MKKIISENAKNNDVLSDVVVPKGAVCGYCNDTGWDSYPNHDTTLRPCLYCKGKANEIKKV